jgi:hypothetical protein
MLMNTMTHMDLVVLQIALFDPSLMRRWLKARRQPIIHPHASIQQILFITNGEILFAEQIESIVLALKIDVSYARKIRRLNHSSPDYKEIRQVVISALHKTGMTLFESERFWDFLIKRANRTWKYNYINNIVNQTIAYEYARNF